MGVTKETGGVVNAMGGSFRDKPCNATLYPLPVMATGGGGGIDWGGGGTGEQVS